MSTLEARIAEVLADHQFQPGFFRCACGKSVADAQLASRAIAAHQASMLAPVIAEAKAEALRAFADEIGDFSSDHIARYIEDMAIRRADNLEAS